MIQAQMYNITPYIEQETIRRNENDTFELIKSEELESVMEN
jgi:hypothetical protein